MVLAILLAMQVDLVLVILHMTNIGVWYLQDTYGTVQPHTLIRQHLDYNHWYDRNKLTPKDIHSVQYIACMNPTAGSFTINPRLQRHFATFAVSFPSQGRVRNRFK